MIKPTVGRMVWYWNQASESEQAQPNAAIIAHVVDDHRVHLAVISEYGVSYGASNVQLVQGAEAVEDRHCRWMPYQLGQAAKTERLAEQLGSILSDTDKQAT